MAGGAIPARQYREGSGVGLRQPVMVLQPLFSSESTDDAWLDLAQTGAQYSAVEQHSARAVVLSVSGFAPHLMLPSIPRRLFLLEIFPFSFFVCSLNESVLSRVTPKYTG